MNWEKFADQFHESWHNKMRPFIESEECDAIYEFLKKEAKRGKQIAPLSSNVFRAFKETSYDDLKVVMLGMCPYHTSRFGVHVADGLLMGCSITNKLQPSLEKFYEGLEKELGEDQSSRSPDVKYLANQGVLMLNAALTTEINKAGSHIDVWQPFTKYFFEKVIDTSGAVVVFLGKDAAKYKHLVAPFSWSFVLSHPASAAYKNTDWDTEGVFTKVNKILKDNNNFHIYWLNEKPPF